MSRICAAVEASDPQQAREAVIQHLTEAAQLAKTILTTEE